MILSNYNSMIVIVMFHYVYQITNLINGKIYVGKHSTENLDDGYMGSGKLITRAVARHGIENFRKHIVKMCETSKEALELERQIVNELFIADENTYNLILGGKCGGTFTSEARAKGLQAQLANSTLREQHKERFVNALRERHVRKIQPIPSWVGRRHDEESKRKIGLANSISQRGDRNSQFGSMWIYNVELRESKKVSKDEYDSYVSSGWLKGRKIKW